MTHVALVVMWIASPTLIPPCGALGQRTSYALSVFCMF